MFAYCGNNPVNYTDENGRLSTQAIISGFINGSLRAISALSTGGSLLEAGVEFAIGFADGFISSYYQWFDTAVRIYDALKTASEYKKSGASDSEALMAALVVFLGSFPFCETGDELVDCLVDATFGFGKSLSMDGLVEAWRMNIENNQIAYIPNNSAIPSMLKNTGRNGGTGGPCVMLNASLSA